MFTLTIPRNYLAAVARFRAVKDIRFYLNGMHVACYPSVAYITCTDGHTLCQARIERPEHAEPFGQGEAIIPSEFFDKVKANGNNGLALVLTVDGDNFTINDCGMKTSGQVIDGKFPDVSRVIPRTVSGKPCFINPEFLMRCQKAAKDLGSKIGYFSLGYNGDESGNLHASLVMFQDPAVFAVLMPMRADPVETCPEWVGENPLDVGRTLDVETAHDEAIKENKAHEALAHSELLAA